MKSYQSAEGHLISFLQKELLGKKSDEWVKWDKE